jgi:hypothetical protein
MVSLGEVGRNVRPYKLTLVYTYFGHQERIEDILKEKHPDVRIVIVDDCSAEPLQPLDGIDVYRVLDNISWNMAGAKNLGFHVSDGWIIYSDIDHLVTRENIEEILQLQKERGCIYFFGRVDVETGEEGTHYSEFLIHKEDFEKVGGFDEDFSGYYGYDDYLFLSHCQKNLKVVDARHIKVKLFDDSYSKGVKRDFTRNKELYEQKLKSQCNEGKRLNFNWILRGLN